MFFNTGLVRMVLLTVLIGFGAALLISTDPLLGLLSLSFVPFVGWRSSVTQLQLRATWLTLQEKLAVLTRVMDENLGGIRVVRAFAAQAFELTKFDRISEGALALAHERSGKLGVIPEIGILGPLVQLGKALLRGIPVKDASAAASATGGSTRQASRLLPAWRCSCHATDCAFDYGLPSSRASFIASTGKCSASQ